MNEGAKQAYLDKMTAQMNEWGAKVEVVKAKLAKEAAGVRIDYHKHIESWQKQEPIFKQKLEELRTASTDGFETLKAGVQSIWNEMNTLITSLEEKKEDKKNDIQ